MTQRFRSRPMPLSDEEFERKLYAAGELTDQELARAGSMGRVRKPLSDAAFERQMRAEEAAKQPVKQRAPIDTNDEGNIYATELGPYRAAS